MANLFYRFRSASALLDQFEELERQEIYFSLPDHLNDPMEGFKNVVWTGDSVLWRNLLKHYLLCMLETACQAMLQGPDFEPEQCHIFLRMTDEDLPDAPVRQMLAQLRDAFFAHEAVSYFVEQANSLGIALKQHGLGSYLLTCSPFLLHS